MNRRMRRFISDYNRAHRRQFLKSSVIGFGFLSGLWVHIGIDPSSVVAQWLQQTLLTLDPAHAPWIAIAFLYGPTLLTFLSIILVYRRAGFLGFIAVVLAYAAGFLLAVESLILIALAILIGWFAARRV
jgi:hypothetical protein